MAGSDLLWLAAGITLLAIGGELVVRGASGLARRLGVSPLMIGLTVVAFGTSAPELAINVIAAIENQGAIAFGSIMGSNMANIGLIVGCTAILRPMVIKDVVIRRELPMMLLATAAALAMGFDNALSAGGSLRPFPDYYTRSDGILLLMFFLVFLYYTLGDFVRARSNRDGSRPASDASAVVESALWRSLALTGLGLALLIGGAELTVDAAVKLARALGVSDEIIGLTVVAVGTSLPELVASLAAAIRGHPELAIGNVVGSNIFNLLLVLGISSIVRPVPVPAGGHTDLLVVAGLSLVLLGVSVSYRRQIVRTEAGLLLAVYMGYLAWRSGIAFGG